MSAMTAATIIKSWLTSGEGLKMWLSLSSCVMLPSSFMRLWMCSLIMNVASLVNVFSAGQSWAMLFNLPKIDCSSLKLWFEVPAARLCRPVTRLCSLAWGRDHVKDAVLKRVPKTSLSMVQSKALVRSGSPGGRHVQGCSVGAHKLY